ncbi:MAG: aminopeptidase, partial [Candidatus Cloacimonetes bacterium]|nr:aminopeptidase [Candidatus Cloacimonadota bacterium]
MNIKISSQIKKDRSLVYILFSDKFSNEFFKKNNIDFGDHDFDKNPLLLLHKNQEFKNLYFYSVGKSVDFKLGETKKIISKMIKKANEERIEKLQLMFCDSFDNYFERLLFIISETIELADYSFEKYKAKKTTKYLKEVKIIVKSENQKYQDILSETQSLTNATNFARTLVNEPANVIFPETLAAESIQAGKKYGFETTIYNLAEIKELKMDAFLSVARGSANEPKLIVMKYKGNPQNPDEIIGLVGKGLTYDSGGYSIKTTTGMSLMKTDMGGAASVIGAISTIAKNKIKYNITAVVAACENMISGEAYKPGDVIGSMAGKFIEIGNTDTEGRLTLIDALYYTITKEKVTKIIDVATLTGAVVVSLGRIRTGALSNNDDFFADLIKASELSGEKFWRLPHDEEYVTQVSHIFFVELIDAYFL